MVYIEPSEIWGKFEENKTILAGHYITCAEDDDIIIRMTVEDGGLMLVAEDFTTGDEHYEVIDSEEEAVQIYEELLKWLSDEEESLVGESEEGDYMDPILAASYAFIGVLTGETPSDLGLTKLDIEDAAYQMAWYIKGRWNLDSILA